MGTRKLNVTKKWVHITVNIPSISHLLYKLQNKIIKRASNLFLLEVEKYFIQLISKDEKRKLFIEALSEK